VPVQQRVMLEEPKPAEPYGAVHFDLDPTPPSPVAALATPPPPQPRRKEEVKKPASSTNFEEFVTIQSSGQILTGDHHTIV
jgi:hypothetical protein